MPGTRVRSVLHSRELLMLAVLLGLAIGVALLAQDWENGSNAFLSHYNLRNLLRRISLLAVAGIGETFVIITGGIDLSVGSMVAFTGVLVATLASDEHFGWPIGSAVTVTLLACAGIGWLHGILITTLRIPPFVTTLASLCILRSVAMVVADSLPIPILDESFQALGNGTVYFRDTLPFPAALDVGIPVPALFCLAVLILTAVYMHRTIWGRYLYALGGNAETARLSGINVDRMICVAYVASALSAGLAGVLFASYGREGNPQDAVAFELSAIAAAVIGGASLAGGTGTMIGTLIGAAILHLIFNGLNLIVKRNASLWEGVVVGAVLLFAVGVATLVRRERDDR